MALTLVESAKLAANKGEHVRAAVIAMFARASDLLMVTPFENISGNAYAYNREGQLPGIAFRGVNEGYTPSTGVINPFVEALRIAGGDLDVDRFLVQTHGTGVRSKHEDMKVKSLASEITRVMIKGDSTSDPREFDGFQSRIPLGSSQLISAGTTDGGDALSLAKLDELIDAVPGCTHLLMNRAMRRKFAAAARATDVAGFVTYTTDSFGRRVTAYNDIPLLVPYSQNDGADPLQFDEQGDLGGTPGGSTSTSIYALRVEPGYLSGIQSGPMDVRDLGELDTLPSFRTRVEWYAGMVVEHGRAIARLGGIANSAIVA